jgi:hypothetical protein
MDFNNTTYSYLKRQEVILGLVGQFHSWLQEHNVKHLFFNTAQSFHPNCQNKVDFGDNFVEPYGDWKNNFQFVEWTKNKGCVPDRWGHYGEDGHAAWAEFLLPYVERILTK